MKEVLNVDGITCDHCVNTIKEAVISLVGISSVEVDIEKKQVFIDVIRDGLEKTLLITIEELTS